MREPPVCRQAQSGTREVGEVRSFLCTFCISSPGSCLHPGPLPLSPLALPHQGGEWEAQVVLGVGDSPGSSGFVEHPSKFMGNHHR